MKLENIEARMLEIERQFELEQKQHPPLLEPEDVPGCPEIVPLAWYTKVLCKGVPGATVTGVEKNRQYHGTTDGQHLVVSYNDAGRVAGLPEYLYAKYSSTLRARLSVGINGASAGEVAFYREILPRIALEAPACYYAGFDELSCRTYFLLEDVSRTKNARFGTAVNLKLDRHMAESMVEQMAKYHAVFWGKTNLPAFPYQDVRSFQQVFNETLEHEKLFDIAFRLGEKIIPAELLALREHYFAAFMRSLDINVTSVQTLLHHDPHLGNWYINEEGSMGLVDWQCIAVGQWALDVSYALSIALSTPQRRAWEKDLIEHYLRCLKKAGVNAPAFDDAWLAYRQQMFHASAWWLASLGSLEFLDDPPVPVEVCEINVQRITQAMVDLDSFASLS